MPGYYIYVGSAFGSGGLQARLLHHCHVTSRPHWHIDYLRKVCKIINIWFLTDTMPYESYWVEMFATLPGYGQPLAGFGATDSKHNTHLFSTSQFPDIEQFRKAAGRQIKGCTLIHTATCKDVGVHV